MNCWWVNQGQTFAQEQGGRYMWSPKASRRKATGAPIRNPFYDYMKQVQPGDGVVAHWAGMLRAFGIATSAAYSADKPMEFGTKGNPWQHDGWRVDVSWRRLPVPFDLKENWEDLGPLFPAKHSPVSIGTRQAVTRYLAPVSNNLVALVLRRSGVVDLDLSRILLRQDPQSCPEVEMVENTAGEGLVGRSRGQGFGLTKLERDAVEAHAMGVAMAFLASARGGSWPAIDDVHRNQPFDLYCHSAVGELHVEVKGTTSDGEFVVLTRNEVQHARTSGSSALLVVAHVTLARGSEPKASGGEVRFFQPWAVSDDDLRPIAFSYAVPSAS